MKIIDAAMHHRRTALLALLLLLLSGAYSYITIPKEEYPDINIPNIYVSMTHEGISPTDAERLLIRPMEQELQSIEGVKEMTSRGYLGGASISLEFNAGFDADEALDDVREKVDRAKPELPEETDEPVVTEVNFSLFPVLIATLSADMPERALLKIARNLQDKIESIPMVLEANIGGDREEQVDVIIDPVSISSYKLNASELLTFFARSDKLVAAGNLDTGVGRFAVKVPGLFETVRDIADMPLKVNGDSVIQVKDIADVRRTFKDPESFARLNGKSTLALEVVKRTGENVIETIEAVQRVIEEERAYWPDGIDVVYMNDSSERIKTMLSDLQNNVISAILLVMIVVVGALGIVSGGLVGVAIPGAFLSGVLIISLMGLTVNVVVLFALILSVGMLVDGAIVVTELADRKMAEGLARMEAYSLAAKRMSWPIISSTATTLAAFFPLLFWPDTVGQFMRYMPITLIAVLLASLLMALVFVPVLGSIFGRPGAVDPKAMKMLSAAEDGNLDDIRGITGVYVSVLKGAINNAGLVVLVSVLALIGIWVYYTTHGNGVKFFPDVEPDNGIIKVHARGNLSIFEQDMLVREVEEKVFAVDGIRAAYTRVGNAPGGGGSRNDLTEDVIATIQIEFKNWMRRKSADHIFQDVRNVTKDIPGIRVTTQKEEAGPPTGKALQIQLATRNPDLLEPAVKRVLEGLNALGGFLDIEDSRPLPGIEWEIEVDRAQASKFGVDVTSIGQAVRTVTNGLKAAEYRPHDAEDEVDIMVRYPLDNRSVSQLDNIRLETPAGSVPITNFVKRVARPKVSRIERADGQRIMTISAEVPPGVNVDARVTEVKNWLAEKGNLDPDIRVTFKGEDEDQKRAQSFLITAFAVALFIMATILVTQFNSFYSAFLILSAVIMSTIGVMIGLLLTGRPFGIVMSGIGVIALAGIVVNNNIVLIDTFDHLRMRGLDVKNAILRTGAQRLRPVMLTAITTILGIMPMVLQMNIDFINRSITIGAPSTQWWVELAIAVAFGLFFATPLTLIVTPCALMLKENIALRFTRRTDIHTPAKT